MAKRCQRFNRTSCMSFTLIIVCLASGTDGSGIVNRIRGGDETSRGDWPFIVALFQVEPHRYFCGGTLISKKHVLTAAHCIKEKGSSRTLLPNNIALRLGAYDITVNNEENAVIEHINQIHVHPEWKVYEDRYNADMAILVLREKVTISKYVQVVPLPADGIDVYGYIINITGTIVGWGFGRNKNPEPIPRQATVKATNDSYCYRHQPNIVQLSSEHTFCAGDGDGIPNHGDSGGGFFVNSSSGWVQYGVISAITTDIFGEVSEDTTFAVFGNVKSFKTWIMDTIEGKITLNCSYDNDVYYQTYLCLLVDLDVRIDELEIASFTGSHHIGNTNQDVNEIVFENGTMFYLPNGIGKCFTNLTSFKIRGSLDLKIIKRSNLKNLTHLKSINVYKNEIETIDEDVLWDLPELKIFQLSDNKLNKLYEKTFQKNLNLKEVILRSNQLKVLPRTLFINNALLKRVDFSENLLNVIDINFTPFKNLHFIFDANVCINENYRMVNLTDFQNHISSKCKE